ncbi:MAG: hypothetical protein KIS63_09420 [Caldilineales bacterium]|nr:hypothetical protein [Caldilineales bacterium]
MSLIVTLDVTAMLTALAASWFWILSTRHKLRRISRNETLDAADVNRIVVAINRTQILNARAALAAAASAACVALRFAMTLAKAG